MKNNSIGYALTRSRRLLMILLGSVLLFESLFYLLPLKDMLLIKIMLGFLPLKAGIFGLMIGQDHQLPYRQALLMLHGPK